MTQTNDSLKGSGFRGGICICRTQSGKFKYRYIKQAKAIKAAEAMPRDAYVYECPHENGVWHTTTHPRPDGKYITPKKGK